MADSIFTEIQSIEAEAERLISEAQAKRHACKADADEQVERLRDTVEQTYNQKTTEARRQQEARLADETRRADEAHQAFVARLDAVRATQIQPLADWVIERLVDADREH